MKTDTCQSVWDAIADSPEEAANLKIRSQLMDILVSYIRSEEITQKEAARRFGVPRSRVSELVNDKISKFTIDKLVNMAARVGLAPLSIDCDLSQGSNSNKSEMRHRQDYRAETCYFLSIQVSPLYRDTVAEVQPWRVIRG